MQISSVIIVGIIFIVCIVLIVTEKINRAVVSLSGAIFIYFWLTIVESLPFDFIVDFIMGTNEDDFTNFHSLIMIFGMMVIISISNEGGLFQFLAFKLIQLTKGTPVKLLTTFCLLSVFTSAVLNNLLAVIILIPLTITVSRILHINPLPYILTQAILVNMGATLFSFSSIPSIMISNYANLTFIEFFLNIGIMSLIIVGFTIVFFLALYKKSLKMPKSEIQILLEFNVWNFVSNKHLMFKSLGVLISVILGFIIVPQNIFPSDMIALSGALILLLICKLDGKTIIKTIDYELFLYLIGIFVIAGAMEYVGIIDMIGEFFLSVSGGDIYSTFMLVLWATSFLSATVDNIPITRILLPAIDVLTEGMVVHEAKMIYYSLAFGTNWGDNLTPLGDNILVVNLCEQNNFDLKMKDFFKIGFITTIYQLVLLTLYFSLVITPLTGILLLIIAVAAFIGIFMLIKLKQRKKEHIQEEIQEIKSHSIN